jgi:hypothetical protein
VVAFAIAGNSQSAVDTVVVVVAGEHETVDVNGVVEFGVVADRRRKLLRRLKEKWRNAGRDLLL